MTGLREAAAADGPRSMARRGGPAQPLRKVSASGTAASEISISSQKTSTDSTVEGPLSSIKDSYFLLHSSGDVI